MRIIGLTASVCLLTAVSCGGGGDTEAAGRDPVISIAVDPRMELLNVVQLLAGAPGLRDPGTDYGAEVIRHFVQQMNHPSVGTVRELTALGFGYDAPVTAVLHLSDPPELLQVTPWSDNLVERAGGRYNLDRFAEALRTFALDTDFMSFFEDHFDYYAEISQTYSSVVDPGDAAMLESLFGMARGSYSVLPAPLSFHGYGSRVEREDGSLDVYCTVMGATQQAPDPETAMYLRSFVWHEFAHSFVNPVCEENAGRIDGSAALYEPLRTVMESQAYTTWEICVREHLVRAAVIRLMDAEYGAEAAEEELEQQLRNGFVYIRPLLEVYRAMESSSGEDGSFESMFPRFLDALESIAEEGPGEYAVLMGATINMVLSLDAPIVYVTPTAETDPAVQADIADYVKSVSTMFNPTAEVLPDTAALSRDLSGTTVIAYGTIRGNLYLRDIADRFPFDVTTYGAIETDTVLAGTRMRLISTLPNPREENGWLVVYTACRALDVPGINSVFHGTTEFVVADWTDILRSGFYRRGEDGWTF